MATPDHIHVFTRLKEAAAKTALDNPALVKALLGGGALALAGGGIGTMLERARAEKANEEARRQGRNTSFGAGVAAGMAGPQIVDALHRFVHRGDQ